jgi:transposase
VGFSPGDFMLRDSRERALAMHDDSFPGWRPEKSIRVIERDGKTRVVLKGQPYMSWRSGDKECLRLAIVQLHECGLGTQEELAEAFGRHVNSVQRYLTGFADEGLRGLLAECRGPKGGWKITPELRGNILGIVLREGIWNLEAIQQRLAQGWNQVVSVPNIQQVLEDDGLSEPKAGAVAGAAVQTELFGLADDQQLVLDLGGGGDRAGQEGDPGRGREKENGTRKAKGTGGQPGAGDGDRGSRRDYSPAQRVYLDQLEQGAHNAYAGGLLFAPLLARYDFVPTLRRGITIPTQEGYRLDELALTLFYMAVFGFRSMEDFKRAYREEFGVLMGRVQSPSLFTLRRFLHKVRELGRGEALIDEFAVAYLRTELAAWGVMYLDGPFMPY